MCIYLSDNAIFVLIFIAGLVLGAIIYRIVTAPMTNQDRRDLQAMRIALNTFEMRNRPAPPKPLHNPNL
jgi:uncharacterized membrane-anchored protein YhcB (DUF1043 family)